MTNDEETELLDRHCAQLGEHFDTVQIFVTRYDSEIGTRNVVFGAGNWFARYGQVVDWQTKKSEETRVGVRKDNDE